MILKSLSKLGIEGNLLSLINTICKNLPTNILMRKDEHFLRKIGNKEKK